MVIDTSVVVAVTRGEPEAADFVDRLRRDRSCISAATVVEAHAVFFRAGVRTELVDEFLRRFSVEIAAFGPDQLPFVVDGMKRFGRGRAAPPAVLNFGDLFAYALARSRGLGLLYKGEDFAMTDVRPAVS